MIFGGLAGGLAVPKEKYVWLKAGDKIACSLEELGELKFELV